MSDLIKKPLFQSLGELVTNRYRTLDDLKGKALPCSVKSVEGAIVTVNFEIDAAFPIPDVTMPVAETPYVRYPIQVGDTGLAIPASVAIAGVFGLGGGLSRPVFPSNLGALVFLPVGSATFAAVDADQLVLTGPDGVTIMKGGSSISVTSSGIEITGALTINGVPYLAHTHSGVTTGGGVSGPVVL